MDGMLEHEGLHIALSLYTSDTSSPVKGLEALIILTSGVTMYVDELSKGIKHALGN